MKLITQDEAICIRKEILDYFHDFCEENGLKYSLGYGTLLGAVRHKGMIPWDDDIDLIMPRKDYDRLEKMFSDSRCTDRYQFVNHRNHPEIKTKIGYFIDYTTMMEVAKRANEYHGIHIDIYPVDLVPDDPKKRKQYFTKWKILQFLIRVKDIHPELFKGKDKWIRNFVKAILFPFNLDKLLDKLNLTAKSFNNLERTDGTLAGCYVESGKLQLFPAKVMNEYKLYDYEGKQYYGFKDYDALLTAWYGDYLTPPEERDRHRPAHRWIRYYRKGE